MALRTGVAADECERRGGATEKTRPRRVTLGEQLPGSATGEDADGCGSDTDYDRGTHRQHQRWLPLFACCARQDGSHQLSRCLTGGRSLAPELAKNVGRKWNIGNEQRSRSQPVGRDLLFQNADELAHAVPSLSGREPRLAGYDTTVRGNPHVLHIAPRDIGVADLQPVDRIVDLVGEVDAVFGGE